MSSKPLSSAFASSGVNWYTSRPPVGARTSLCFAINSEEKTCQVRSFSISYTKFRVAGRSKIRKLGRVQNTWARGENTAFLRARTISLFVLDSPPLQNLKNGICRQHWTMPDLGVINSRDPAWRAHEQVEETMMMQKEAPKKSEEGTEESSSQSCSRSLYFLCCSLWVRSTRRLPEARLQPRPPEPPAPSSFPSAS